LGKNSILWGTGYDGVIGLSGVNPSFDFIKLPLKFWKIKYVNILGFPLDDIPVGSKSEIVSKYLSAHRIELQPFSGVCIGWQEAYIYYEKLYPQLINPVMPYGMAHVYMGDVGNYATEGDIEFCALPNTKLYASLFLDDLHYLENPFTYAGNKWAALGGILIVDPFRLENLDFRAEYARIEPWAYTHAGITNEPSVPTSYKNSDSLLGHWIGANADDMFFEINRWLSRDLQIALSYRRIRKGEIGGSIYEYDASVNNGGKKRFLEGVIEKEHNISLDLKYRILDDSKIEIKCSHIKMHNKQNEEAKLPPYDKRKQPWKSGNNWSQNTVEVSVSLEY